MSDAYNGEPWTVGVEIQLRRKPHVQMVSLLTDEAGASLIAKGILPAYVQQQAKDALEWLCTEERAPEHERGLFDEREEDPHVS